MLTVLCQLLLHFKFPGSSLWFDVIHSVPTYLDDAGAYKALHWWNPMILISSAPGPKLHHTTAVTRPLYLGHSVTVRMSH